MSVVGDCTKCDNKQLPVDEQTSMCGACYWKIPDPYMDKLEEIKKLLEAILKAISK